MSISAPTGVVHHVREKGIGQDRDAMREEGIFRGGMTDRFDGLGGKFRVRFLPGGKVDRDGEGTLLHRLGSHELLIEQFPQKGRRISDFDAPGRADEWPTRQIAGIALRVKEVREPEHAGDGFPSQPRHVWLHGDNLSQKLQDDALRLAPVHPFGKPLRDDQWRCTKGIRHGSILDVGAGVSKPPGLWALTRHRDTSFVPPFYRRCYPARH